MLEHYSKVMIIINSVFMAVAVTSVLLRVLARRTQRICLAADDYAIVAAMIIAIANSILSIYVSSRDVYSAFLTYDQASLRNKAIFINVILTHVVYALTKISLLLLYRKVFSVPWLQRTADILMALIVAWLISMIITNCLAVTPLYWYWTKLESAGGFPKFKFQYNAFLAAQAAIDFSFDILIILLPMRIINSLNVNRKKRVLLGVIFGVGILSKDSFGYASCSTAALFVSLLTFLESAFLLDMWATIETLVSIATACLPTLAPIARKGSPIFTIFTSLRSLFNSSTGHATQESRRKSTTNKRRAAQNKLSSENLVPGGIGWYELQAGTDTEPVKSSSPIYTYNVESRSVHGSANEIRVQKKFGTYVES